MPVYSTEYMAEPFETVLMGGGFLICADVVTHVEAVIAGEVLNVAMVDFIVCDEAIELLKVARGFLCSTELVVVFTVDELLTDVADAEETANALA